MIKRGIIQLGGADPKIRISRQGVDVDSAVEEEFLLHESFLYSQPYHFSFVECPSSGGSATKRTVSVTIPDVSDSPIPLIWMVNAEGAISSPVARDRGNHSGGGFNLEYPYVFTGEVSSTQIDIIFIKPSISNEWPGGAYLVLMRGES